MKETVLGSHLRKVPSIAVGCMRLSEKSKDEMNHFIHSALEQGAYFFDHADIYGSGMSETVFGDAFASDPSLHREDVLIQSKCGIRQGCYDLSKEHILESVDGILKRLQTDYLDLLLLHRPDALVEPEEVAAAFDVLFESGKVRHFGVSNHKPMQIALLQKYVRQPLVVNQVQFSIPVSNLVANGMEVNMETPGLSNTFIWLARFAVYNASSRVISLCLTANSSTRTSNIPSFFREELFSLKQRNAWR